MSNQHFEQPYSSVPQTAGRVHLEEQLPQELIELNDINSLDFERTLLHDDEQGEGSNIQQGDSNMKMAFMNMANSILGAGIIGQPFAFKNAGLIGGIVVMVFLTILIDWTLRLIIINSHLAQTRSYQDTVNYCFGKYGKWLLTFAVNSFCYGGLIAFSIILGDTIPHVLTSMLPTSITTYPAISWLFYRNTIIVIFTTCISYPLSLNRDISKLAKASGFALVGMFIIVVITIFRGPFAEKELKAQLTTLEWTVNYNIFQGISVISFALVCHHNTMFIYRSMKNASIEKFSILTHIACGVSMIFCLLMGVNGLVNFGDNTKGNILNNFKSTDKWANVARFFFGLNMLTTFPLELFVVRDALKDIVFSNHEENNGSTAHLELSSKQHFLITTLLVFSAMSVSLFTCNLGMILELIGAISASLMAYIIPPLCYLKLTWNQIDYKNLNTTDKRDYLIWKAAPSISCALFGCLLMFISSYMSILTGIKGESDGHCVTD